MPWEVVWVGKAKHKTTHFIEEEDLLKSLQSEKSFYPLKPYIKSGGKQYESVDEESLKTNSPRVNI